MEPIRLFPKKINDLLGFVSLVAINAANKALKDAVAGLHYIQGSKDLCKECRKDNQCAEGFQSNFRDAG